MSDFLTFLGIGRLFIFFLQKSPISRNLPEGLIKELFECDLCLGFWIYLFLGLGLKKHLDDNIKKNWLISALATATFSSLVMHLLAIGWKEKFSTIIIE